MSAIKRFAFVIVNTVNTLWYWFAWSLLLLLFRVFYRLHIRGKEKVPRRGCFIIASNHASHFDPPLLGLGVRRKIGFFAKRPLFKNPFFGGLIKSLGAVPLSPKKSDLKAMHSWIRFFRRAGKPFVLFPEGERTPNGELLPAKPGIGMVVDKFRIPVLPMYIKGSFDALPRHSSRPRFGVKITITIGELIPVEEMIAEADKSEENMRYEAIAEYIMEKISKLKELE